jgi:glycosyltransferase involved in cell wall biosynthesis
MKILLINKFFFSFGGTETAFFQAAKLLRDQGHEVIIFSMAHPRNRASRQSPHFVSRVDFEEMSGWREKARAVERILFGRDAQAKLDGLLRVEKPDVAHLHNIYHHLSPAIIATLKKHKVPVVMTLHDYKVVCPSYKMFVRGEPCERCRDSRFFWCGLRRCVKNSLAKSLLCSLEARLHRKSYARVDRFISPSRFLIGKIKEMGFTGRCDYIPNFVGSSRAVEARPPRDPLVLFFGRLVEEKGVSSLIEAMQGVPADCLIIGDGPEKKALQAQAAQSPAARVRFLAHQPPGLLREAMRRSSLVVVPSIWYENNPFSIIESFAMGVPVLAARIGGIPELVSDRETGMLFTAGSSVDLREKVMLLLQDPGLRRELAKNARRHLEMNFPAARHHERLLGLYRELIEAGSRS